MKLTTSKNFGLILAALGVVSFSVVGHAQTFLENPNELDTGISTGTSAGSPVAPYLTDTTNYQVRVGEDFSPGGEDYVMPFLLPTLTAGEVITAASLQVTSFGAAGTPDNADLYAIGTLASPTVSSSPTVSAGDYYQGPADTANTLLQQNFLTSATFPASEGFVTTSLTGNAALLTFLNAAEAGGANAGDYVFLRISYDDSTIPNGNNAYSILTDDAGGATEKPVLTITAQVAPEPSTWALLGVGLLSLTFFVRRRAVAVKI